MARTTKEQALKTRAHLIDTAIEVFFARGVTATTLEQVAEAAQLSRGALYWHFKNKLDLVSAVHEHFHLSILETVNRELTNPNLPPLERLKQTWRQFLHGIADNDMYRKVLTIFMIKCDYSGEMSALLVQQLKCKSEARQLITQSFQAAIDTKSLAPTYPAEQLTQTHMCYMHGILHEYILFDKVPQLKRDADALISFYFNQLPHA